MQKLTDIKGSVQLLLDESRELVEIHSPKWTRLFSLTRNPLFLLKVILIEIEATKPLSNVRDLDSGLKDSSKKRLRFR